MSPIQALAVIAVIPMLSLATSSIEYTSFYPGRYQESQEMKTPWGERWQWPLKTFPPKTTPYNGATIANTLDKTYGLVYWPGEKVSVNVTGGSGTITMLTVKSVLSSDTLPVTKAGTDAFTITIPNNGQKAPYLEVYRVHAYAGTAEVASRGLIVTVPWSGWSLIGKGDPRYYNKRMEFSGSFGPSLYMSMYDGGFPESHPARIRAWHSGASFSEFEWGYATRSGRQDSPTTDLLKDSTVEWNRLWYYYGQGAGIWDYANKGAPGSSDPLPG